MTEARQLVLELPSRAAMGRDDFLVTAANRDAVAWIDRWPDWPAPALILYGPAGCGKTHLAQVWQSASAARSGPRALQDAGPGGEALCLDVNGVIEDEERLFHAYNRALAAGGSILLTGRVPASAWAITLPDLRSRLQAAPNIAMEPPDDALLSAILVKLFADRQLEVDPNVLNYLLTRMERSFVAANRIVGRLDSAALAARRRITVPLAREVLEA